MKTAVLRTAKADFTLDRASQLSKLAGLQQPRAQIKDGGANRS